MSLASNLTPGDSNFNIVEKISEQIFKMVKDIIDKKSDDIVYNIIGPQIENNMASLFTSYPVQLEASKMFNRELFPIYKRALEDFAKFNNLVKEAKEEINKAIEEYTTAILANPNDNAAKEKLIQALMRVSNEKVGDVFKLKEGDEKEGNGLSMEGGGLQSFLENKDNEFTPIDGGTPAPEYIEGETNRIDKALGKILGGMKEKYDECNKGIKENIEANEKFNEEIRKKKEKKQGPDDLGNKPKMGGGKSKRRKHRKRSKTHKKRR